MRRLLHALPVRVRGSPAQAPPRSACSTPACPPTRGPVPGSLTLTVSPSPRGDERRGHRRRLGDRPFETRAGRHRPRRPRRLVHQLLGVELRSRARRHLEGRSEAEHPARARTVRPSLPRRSLRPRMRCSETASPTIRRRCSARRAPTRTFRAGASRSTSQASATRGRRDQAVPARLPSARSLRRLLARSRLPGPAVDLQSSVDLVLRHPHSRAEAMLRDDIDASTATLRFEPFAAADKDGRRHRHASTSSARSPSRRCATPAPSRPAPTISTTTPAFGRADPSSSRPSATTSTSCSSRRSALPRHRQLHHRDRRPRRRGQRRRARSQLDRAYEEGLPGIRSGLAHGWRRRAVRAHGPVATCCSDAIGAGGMATVHLGRRVGAGGFARLVAVKRLHPHLAVDREVVHAFLDEARIAARVTHANVVSIHDVVLDGDEVLSAERAAGRTIPPPIAGAIAIDLLRGLQAAHEARDERGRLLGVIHRDVSPHNVLVGTDGVARVLDFGIAKALGRLQTTATGAVKGKLAYMAPERLLDQEATARVGRLRGGDRRVGDAGGQALLRRAVRRHDDPAGHRADVPPSRRRCARRRRRRAGACAPARIRPSVTRRRASSRARCRARSASRRTTRSPRGCSRSRAPSSRRARRPSRRSSRSPCRHRRRSRR